MSNTRNSKTFKLTVTAVMTAIASIIYMVFPEINIIPGVSYMKIDFSDFPAILTGLVLGPVHGILVEIIKNIIHLTRTTTVGIGEIMNVVMGTGIILSMYGFTKLFSKIFKEKKFSFRTYIISAIITILITIIVGWLANMVFTPIFYKLIGIPFVAETYWAGVWGSTALNAVKATFNVIPFYPVYYSIEKAVKKYTM
ncbi:MAG: ECF transporter S component [Clostridia bacterium]|nr:ECF transporter S component [Clostridia bacterium]